MDAKTFNCPMCGAPASPGAVRCDHCRAPLASVACPACFGMVFQGSQFCPHCGAKLGQPEPVTEPAVMLCPRCQGPMSSVVIGTSKLDECEVCKGVWTDVETLNAIRDNSLKLAAADVVTAPETKPVQFTPELDNIRYLPCPVCKKLMNRVNFGGISGVIVDVCRGHGTWFDPGELQHIVEFIRTGGIDESRRREQASLAARESARKQTTMAAGSIPAYGGGWDSPVGAGSLAGLLADVAGVLLRLILR